MIPKSRAPGLPGPSVLGVLQTKIMRVNPRLGDCVLGLRGDTRVAEAFGVASVEMIPKGRAPGWLLTAAAAGSSRRPCSLLRPRPMEAERGCGWPGCPISAALAADQYPKLGSPVASLFSSPVPCSLLLEPPQLSSSFHPRISFSLPGNCCSQISQTSPTAGLWSRLHPCSQDESQQVERREAQTSPPGLPYLDRRRLLRWAKVCFHNFIHRIFVTKTLQSDFSREFLFLIFKLLFKFQYQIINRYNFSEHLQRGHLQDLAQKNNVLLQRIMSF